MRLIYNMTALLEQRSDPIISNKHIKTKIATCYIMLHHVTLHVTLRLLYFIIALDMLQHVTPTFKETIVSLKCRCNML